MDVHHPISETAKTQKQEKKSDRQTTMSNEQSTQKQFSTRRREMIASQTQDEQEITKNKQWPTSVMIV